MISSAINIFFVIVMVLSTSGDIKADTLDDVKAMSFIVLDWSESCTDNIDYTMAYRIKCPKYRDTVNVENINNLKAKVSKSIAYGEYSDETVSLIQDYMDIIDIEIVNKNMYVR